MTGKRLRSLRAAERPPCFFERPRDRNDDAAKYVSEPLSASPGPRPIRSRAGLSPARDVFWLGGRPRRAPGLAERPFPISARRRFR